MTRESLERAEQVAREIGRELKSRMPHGWGFILWLESFGRDGFATYLSSIERETAIRSIKEWIVRMDTTPKTSEFVDATDLDCWCCGTKTGLVTFRGPHRSVELCQVCMRRNDGH